MIRGRGGSRDGHFTQPVPKKANPPGTSWHCPWKLRSKDMVFLTSKDKTWPKPWPGIRTSLWQERMWGRRCCDRFVACHRCRDIRAGSSAHFSWGSPEQRSKTSSRPGLKTASADGRRNKYFGSQTSSNMFNWFQLFSYLFSDLLGTCFNVSCSACFIPTIVLDHVNHDVNYVVICSLICSNLRFSTSSCTDMHAVVLTCQMSRRLILHSWCIPNMRCAIQCHCKTSKTYWIVFIVVFSTNWRILTLSVCQCRFSDCHAIFEDAVWCSCFCQELAEIKGRLARIGHKVRRSEDNISVALWPGHQELKFDFPAFGRLLKFQ